MKKVNINNIELVYTVSSTKRVMFSIESKIKLVELYLNTQDGDKMYKICNIRDNIPEWNINNHAVSVQMSQWVRQYKSGKLSISNSFTVSRRETKKVTITLEDKIQDKQAEIDKLTKELSILIQAKELLVA